MLGRPQGPAGATAEIEKAKALLDSALTQSEFDFIHRLFSSLVF